MQAVSTSGRTGFAGRRLDVERLERRLFLSAGAVSGASAPAYVSFRSQTGADMAQSTFGVSGQHVCVAILDRGIDYTLPDFRNPDGTTRIKWMLDMTGDNIGDPSSPPPVEYSQAQINAALQSGTPLGERDAVGHGTVTAGLAAGNGSAAAGGLYKGMAPNADLIIVKLTSEGAPAHGNQPAEAPFQASIDHALDWLDQKITQLGEPCVALINSGTQWGPIDGTSAVSRKIDEVFGADRPGRVYVAAAGDEGNLANHAGGTFDASGTSVRFNVDGAGSVYGQAWYTGSEPAQITFHFDDGTTLGPVAPGQSASGNGVQVIQYQPGQEFYPWQSTSGDRAIWFNITGHSGGGTITIQATGPGSGKFDVYGDAGGVLTFSDHLVAGRLTDYASTRSAIVAGAQVLLDSYTDIDGIDRTVPGDPPPGSLWPGSSAGPTRDGRTYGVDVVAPGENAFAAYAPNSYWATFRFNEIQGGSGFYGRGGATSGAAPIVVGAIALMLQEDPTLTADQVRQILHQTAISDSFTGATPNAQWGYGKLNVFAAVKAISGGISGTVFHDSNYDGVQNSGETGLPGVTVFLDLNHDGTLDPQDPQTTTDGSGNYSFVNLAPGIYVVREVVPAGYRPTTPLGDSASVTVGLGQVAGGTVFGLVRTSEVLLDFNYLVRLARNYSKPGTIATGDLNNDGIVNFADLVLLARNYGKTLPAIAPAASEALIAPAAHPTVSAAVHVWARHRIRGSRNRPNSEIAGQTGDLVIRSRTF